MLELVENIEKLLTKKFEKVHKSVVLEEELCCKELEPCAHCATLHHQIHATQNHGDGCSPRWKSNNQLGVNKSHNLRVVWGSKTTKFDIKLAYFFHRKLSGFERDCFGCQSSKYISIYRGTFLIIVGYSFRQALHALLQFLTDPPCTVRYAA